MDCMEYPSFICIHVLMCLCTATRAEIYTVNVLSSIRYVHSFASLLMPSFVAHSRPPPSRHAQATAVTGRFADQSGTSSAPDVETICCG